MLYPKEVEEISGGEYHNWEVRLLKHSLIEYHYTGEGSSWDLVGPGIPERRFNPGSKDLIKTKDETRRSFD